MMKLKYMDLPSYRLYKGAWIYDGAPDEEHFLDEDSCFELLKRGGYLVRNVFDFDCNEEPSFWYVIKDCFGRMEALSSKMRNQVRKSLNVYDFRKIDRSEFLRIALPIYNEALSSYRVKAKEVTYSDMEKVSNGDGLDFCSLFKGDK